MCAVINNPASCEVRAVIWFLLARNNNAAKIHRHLCEVYGPNVMSDSKVRQWCRLFKEGRMNVHDEERSGRPSVIKDDMVEKVNTTIRGNCRFTISELSFEFPQVSRSVIYNIVSEKLGYKKLCARWVPKMLTDEHKQKRLAAAHQFLQHHQIEGDQSLDHIVTGDETWISYTNMESKRQSMQWRHSSSSKAKKFKQASSVRKIMVTIFWDRKEILLIDFLERGLTINADAYCETVRKHRRVIQNKRRGMLSSGIVLLHDNARPHTAPRTAQLLQQFRWEVFDNPPYSPDLAPSDYHLFMHLKQWLASQSFEDDDRLKTGVTTWFKWLAADFFDTGIRKLVPRYQKCVEDRGDYVEK